MAPTAAGMVESLHATLTPMDLQLLQQKVLQVHAAEPLLNYVQDLVAATRSGRWFLQGLSPRAGIAVVRAAKAQALLSGRDYVAPGRRAGHPAADGRASPDPRRRCRPRPPRAGARHDGGGAAAV